MTLEKGLGAAWTLDVANTRSVAYVTLSDCMIGGAYGRPAAAE